MSKDNTREIMLALMTSLRDCTQLLQDLKPFALKSDGAHIDAVTTPALKAMTDSLSLLLSGAKSIPPTARVRKNHPGSEYNTPSQPADLPLIEYTGNISLEWIGLEWISGKHQQGGMAAFVVDHSRASVAFSTNTDAMTVLQLLASAYLYGRRDAEGNYQQQCPDCAPK